MCRQQGGGRVRHILQATAPGSPLRLLPLQYFRVFLNPSFHFYIHFDILISEAGTEIAELIQMAGFSCFQNYFSFLRILFLTNQNYKGLWMECTK